MIHRFARPIPVLATMLIAIGTATGQCTFSSLSMNSYGQGCTTVFATPTTLSGSLSVSTCELDLTVNTFPGCCNTFLSARVLALGTQQTNLPVPQLGAGCTMLLQPIGVLFLPSSGGDTFTLNLPSMVPPLSFHVQAAAIYFTTIGLTTEAQLSEGMTVTLQ